MQAVSNENLRSQMEAVLSSLDEGVIISDLHGNILSMNPAAMTIHEFRSVYEAMRSLSDYQEMFELFDMEGQPIALSDWPLGRALRGETFSNYEVQVCRKDTCKRWIGNYGARPVRDNNGDVTLIVLTLRDVTARIQAEASLHHSEERYRALVEMSPDAIFVNRQDRIEYVNAACLRLFGATSPDQVIGKSPLEFHPLEYHALIKERIARGFHGKSVPLIEEQVLQLDGSVRDVEVAASPFVDRKGSAIQVILRDITDRKRIERQLKEMNESLELRVVARTLEVQQLADQLRALAGELSQTEQRERKRLAMILHDHIQQLLVAAQLQLRIVTRTENAGQKPKPAATRAEEILADAIASLRSLTVELSPPVLHQSGLIAALAWLAVHFHDKHMFKVHLIIQRKEEPACEESRTLLFEAVRELLLNAVKHSGAQEATVTVDCAKDGLLICVDDNGKGFDPAQIHASNADQSGLGLFSIQQRLAYAGGHMEIDSAPERGTRVRLFFHSDALTQQHPT